MRLVGLRSALTVLTLLAFVAQGFIVQTHIHGVTQHELTALSTGKVLPGSSNKGKLPIEPDEKNCPLCRLSVFVGSCVVPVAAVILPVAVPVFLPRPEITGLPVVETVSFSWQVRAPPR